MRLKIAKFWLNFGVLGLFLLPGLTYAKFNAASVTAYDVLGVARNADDATIKSAYRKLAKDNHPDLGGIDEVMAWYNEAYEILKAVEKRRLYDRDELAFRGYFISGRPEEVETAPANDQGYQSGEYFATLNFFEDAYANRTKTDYEHDVIRLLFELLRREHKTVHLLQYSPEKKAAYTQFLKETLQLGPMAKDLEDALRTADPFMALRTLWESSNTSRESIEFQLSILRSLRNPKLTARGLERLLLVLGRIKEPNALVYKVKKEAADIISESLSRIVRSSERTSEARLIQDGLRTLFKMRQGLAVLDCAKMLIGTLE